MALRILFFISIFLFSFPFLLAQNRKWSVDADRANYSSPHSWAALPFRKDKADFIPRDEVWVHDSLKEVDVFYIYPTLYQRGKNWNADIQNRRLNRKIEKYPIKFQASVFNRHARVYAPFYRQAVVEVFYKESPEGARALDIAYADIKAAFEEFLHLNAGRPIILASHSQGTYHAARLLKDYFDGTELQNRLVCAYVVGLEIYREQYDSLKPCSDSAQTGCYVTWSSFSKKYRHSADKPPYYGNVCVNPISWDMSQEWSSTHGSVFLSVRNKKRYKTEVKLKGNYLEVKTKLPFVRHWKNLHLVDYNLFWDDIRRNVGLRVSQFKKNS